MTNGTPRELTIDFSFLKPGNYQAEIFRDGINAVRDATDYKKDHALRRLAESVILRCAYLSPGR
jgi:alpha-glucosidase